VEITDKMAEKWILYIFTKTANQSLMFKNRKLAVDCVQQILKTALDKIGSTGLDGFVTYEDDFGGIFAFPICNLTAYKIELLDQRLERLRELEIKRLEEQQRGDKWNKNDED
jgi:hypothetical protein